MFTSAGSSPPSDASPYPPSTPAQTNNALVVQPATTTSKKRKIREAAHAASSPAPTDANATENVVLAARNDLSARPRLTISRHPVLVPISEGSPYHTAEQIAMNRLGFRYTPAGIAPPGSTLPCRTIESEPPCLRVSWEDRSPFVKVTTDGLGLLGDKGFRSARCNVPVREGRWYMEVKIELGGGEPSDHSGRREGSHVRLGWGRREAPLNGPVGLDGYSYGYRDKSGERVTLSRPRPYGRPFTTGDVIGMYISLPPKRKASENNPHDPAHVKREHIPIEFKGQEYFESLEYPVTKEMVSLMDFSNKAAKSAPAPPSLKKSATVKNLPKHGRGGKSPAELDPLRSLSTLSGSFIAFFVNGECQGVAFQDLYDYLPLYSTGASRKAKEKKRSREGAREHKENPFDDGTLGYYPFVSLFNHARVRINPGPEFAYPPPLDIDAFLKGEKSANERTWRPILERYPEYMAEQWVLDEKEEEEAKVEAVHRAAQEKVEAEKKALKDKKREQAEARKRAKKAAAEGQKDTSALQTDDDRAMAMMTTLSIPLQNLQRFELGDQIHSPAPTVASSVDIHNPQSGYTSDHVEVEAESGRGGEGGANVHHVPQILDDPSSSHYSNPPLEGTSNRIYIA